MASENLQLAVRLTSAFATGSMLGLLFFLIGSGISAVVPTLPAFTDVISFFVGFAGAIAVAMSDAKRADTST